MSLTLVEQAILISACEDYTTLHQAALEAKHIVAKTGEATTAQDAVGNLISEGYLELCEIEWVSPPRELRRLDGTEATEFLGQSDSWEQPDLAQTTVVELASTAKGEAKFRELLRTPLHEALRE